ncbi:MAG TPA: M20/M25/M40 family metallo-hydrolase [Oscillospiraceae bacterium]|nr:M20/M25/M40 family metallo-hydrolase [Oscillospiraceae bacterium]
MDTIELLKKLCEPEGTSGAEDVAAKTAADLLSRYGKTYLSPLGSVICEVAPEKNGRHVLLDAHLDQIGLIVVRVDERGFASVRPCGGIDRRSISGSSVRMMTKSGPLPGVIGAVPPHLQKDEKKENPKPEELAVDLALSAEEAKKLVRPGDRVILCDRFSEIGDGYVTSPALDDRAGCACILKALEALEGKELPCGLSAVFSTREEVGGGGSRTAAFALRPTEALEMDVSFGATPDTKPGETGEMKKGPMIGFSPMLDRGVCERLAKLAQSNGIPYQYEIMEGETGTNADEIAKVGAGVRCGMLSIPQQYMHTVIEKVAVEDIEAVGRLIAAYMLEGGAD